MGRTLGIILIAGGILVGAVIVVLMTTYVREGSLTTGAATLGAVLGFLVLVLPQLGIGAFLLLRGRQEAVVADRAAKQRQLIGIVKTRGQVDVAELALELGVTRDEAHDLIHDLVGMGLYTGYINWDEGTLYSRQASELRSLSNCYNCNGKLELAGKGVIRCPYCGTEYFLD